MDARSEKTGITAERVVEEYARIAFASISDVMTLEGGMLTIRDFSELTEGQIAAISSIKPLLGKSDASEDDEGSGIPVVVAYEIRFHDKLTALAALKRHTMGLPGADATEGAAIALERLILGGLAAQARKKAQK
jgi:phage terminase small subunit